MGNITFQNASKQQIVLQVEPWAQVLNVPPGAKVEFAYRDDDPAPNIGFSYDGPGEVAVGLLAGNVIITTDDGLEMRYGFDSEPDH